MKITYRKGSALRRWKPLYVTASKFDADSFPVPVRYLQLGQRKVPATAPEIAVLEPPEIPPSGRQETMNPIDAVDRALVVARQMVRPASAF